MSTTLKCLLMAIFIASVVASNVSYDQCAEEPKLSIQDKILANFEHDSKLLFKVWHLVHKKDYDYNTMEGINKYRTFKKKLAEIKQHNASNSSYKKGLNHLSDMTDDEVRSYYNLKPMTIKQLRKRMMKETKFSLDDYNDDEEVINVKPYIQAKTNVDWSKRNKEPRNQGSCGSCWAFTTQAVMENNYNDGTRPDLTDYFSTQQLVDCDTSNGGCNGGWFEGALMFYQNNAVCLEAAYPYTGVQANCEQDKKSKTNSKVKDFTSLYDGWNMTDDAFWKLLSRGAVAVAVDANNSWFSYKSGVCDGDCSAGVNHAVTLVGYNAGGKCSGAYWLIRNSWGTSWGENGFIKIKDEVSNNKSCNIGKYAFQPTGFTN